jgi:gas vesicle protein
MPTSYDHIPVSKKTREGMSLNIDDRAYLQRMFCLQDEVTEKYISDVYDTHAILITDTVREMLDEQKEQIIEMLSKFKEDIFCELKEIRKDIADLKSDIKGINLEIEDLRKRVAEHDFRLQRIEKKLEL